tara:strand:- start:684 stop:1088 length:405 start_codon:yes stop_codon:yes gene_type:complete
MYSQNNIDTNFTVKDLSLEGDRAINLFLESSLKRFSNLDYEKKYNIKIKSEYQKNIIAKDLSGSATDYELVLITNLYFKRTDIIESKSYQFTFSDSFVMKKQDDKYEETSYERLLKRSLADSAFEKIIFKLLKD